MNKISTLFLTLFLSLYFTTSAQVDTFQEDIIAVLNTNGTVEEYDFEYEKTLVSLRVKVASSDTPQSFWDKFKEGKEQSVKEVLSIIAFAYRKHFTHPEIIEIKEYYSTTAAKKLLNKEAEFTPEELQINEEFNSSPLSLKVKVKQKDLALDINKIVADWKRELFTKGLGALAKAGYTK